MYSIHNCIISPIWDKFLRIHLLKEKQWFRDILSFIKEEYRKDVKICPDKKNIFKMFRLLSPSKINVVMIFQDPYPQLQQNGECVSNGIGLAAPYLTKSLKNFSDCTKILGKIDPTMMNFINQGVFSINKYLTVEANSPLSHSEFNKTIYGRPLRWDLLILSVIKRLDQTYDNIVYILFGQHARDYSKYINKNSNLIIETSHPSNRGYKYGLLYSDFAQKTNDYLEKNGKTKIKWKSDIS